MESWAGIASSLSRYMEVIGSRNLAVAEEAATLALRGMENARKEPLALDGKISEAPFRLLVYDGERICAIGRGSPA